RVAVGAYDRNQAVDIRAGIKPRRGLGAADGIGVRTGRNLRTLVAQRDELAVMARAELDLVTRLGTERCNGKALVAGGNELDRPVQLPGNARDDRRAWRHRSFRAERATHEI